MIVIEIAMIQLIEQIDVITFRAKVSDRVLTVWEFENDLAMCIHLQSIKLEKELAMELEQARRDLTIAQSR
jgi:hypothetical protein